MQRRSQVPKQFFAVLPCGVEDRRRNMNFLVLLFRGNRRPDGGRRRSSRLRTYRSGVMERSSWCGGGQVVRSLGHLCGRDRTIIRQREKRRPDEVFATSI